MVDAGQHQGVLGGDVPVGGLQAHVGYVSLGAGKGGNHSAGVRGVDVEADRGVDGGGVTKECSFCRCRAKGAGQRRAWVSGRCVLRAEPWSVVDRPGAPPCP